MQHKSKLKNNFYISRHLDNFVLTNVETHETYELDPETFKKLVDENAVYHKDFVDANLVTKSDEVEKEWPFALITKFFLQGVTIKESELVISADAKKSWESYLEVCEDALDKIERIPLPEHITSIDLPPARKVTGDLYDTLKMRRSVREFTNKSVSLQEFADILFITFGKFHDGFGHKYLDFERSISWRRSSPSAGGLNNLDAYLLVHRVDGLEPGIYFYNGLTHQLLLIKLGEYENELSANFMSQPFHEGCAFIILTVGELKKIAMKYTHPLASTFPFLDNGHVVQTAWLVALNLGLMGWLTAALCHEYFAKLFGLRSTQIPVSAFCIGYGVDESLGPKNREILDEIKADRLKAGAMAMAAVKEKVLVKNRKSE